MTDDHFEFGGLGRSTIDDCLELDELFQDSPGLPRGEKFELQPKNSKTFEAMMNPETHYLNDDPKKYEFEFNFDGMSVEQALEE